MVFVPTPESVLDISESSDCASMLLGQMNYEAMEAMVTRRQKEKCPERFLEWVQTPSHIKLVGFLMARWFYMYR